MTCANMAILLRRRRPWTPAQDDATSSGRWRRRVCARSAPPRVPAPSGVAGPGSGTGWVPWLPDGTGAEVPTGRPERSPPRPSTVLDHRCAPAPPTSTAAGRRFMSEALWATRPRLATPEPAVWRGEPTTLAELRAMRMQLRELLSADRRPPGATGDDVDRLLLAFEELVSNGLRHGTGPVRAAVTPTASGWLLEVSDAAGESPPVPAVDRDAALGGLGLYLVAQLSGAHGWAVDDEGRKVVWARVDVEGPGTVPVPAAVPAADRAPRPVAEAGRTR